MKEVWIWKAKKVVIKVRNSTHIYIVICKKIST